ncbi:hypothetical protein [Cyanobium sp. Morenito 9A2]|uniref:hypothetical protein n=1 Tax=Cyanobium sp. Morenito 9A2 TaxID=2823718 RepID=UPI0020CFC8E2|nr:hypothetical protein [Cyanobium sp. Morenito 9A2]MCP9850799.1 hypothetical protein [Cyanobium sp. Morenito 9A2]
MAPSCFDGTLQGSDRQSSVRQSSAPRRPPARPGNDPISSSQASMGSKGQPQTNPLKPGQMDPAVEPLRRARPQRFRDARPGHLAVVAMAGRPWFIGRICDLSRGQRAAQCFARVIDIDTGAIERIPAPWIVELLGNAIPDAPSIQR